MTYLIVGVVLAWLVFDAFSETLVNGTPFLKAFKIKWSDRLLNAKFQKTFNHYNQWIEENGESYSVRKDIFAYLDYDEYVTLTLYKKNTLIQLEYSITNDEVNVRKTNLNEMKSKDSYYGRWISGYFKQLKQSKVFNGDYKKTIEDLIGLAIDSAIKSEQNNNVNLKKYNDNYQESHTDYKTIIASKKNEMIRMLEKELI